MTAVPKPLRWPLLRVHVANTTLRRPPGSRLDRWAELMLRLLWMVLVAVAAIGLSVSLFAALFLHALRP